MDNLKFFPKITIFFLILAVFLIQPFLGLQAEVGSSSTAVIDIQDTAVRNSEIKLLNKKIQAKKKSISNIQKKQAVYSEAIKKAQEAAASLDNQLSILENRIAKTELDIEKTQSQIDQVNLEIQKLKLEIKDKQAEIETDRQHIANILKALYKKDSVSSLEIILMNNSLSDFINEVQYLEDINKGVKASLANLKAKKDQLERQKNQAAQKQKKLMALKQELKENKEKLESEKDEKMYILDQTRLSEERYQRLLAEARKEQMEVAAEIASLEKTVRKKIAALNNKKLEFNDNGFIWPVPKNVITAYFHDPDYPFRHIFEHPGVDIRAAQGTPIKAAASGYVARAKNGGKHGYSYIMIVHGDNFSTVYGHVSKIYVKEDEYVIQGQTIGLSGGLPGTPGAGRFTTGPHLHFEIRLNGIPVNPLEYLP